VTTIPHQYGSTVADVVALAVLGLFLAALLAHLLHEVRRLRSEPASR
jgi:hypothetical protein